MSTAGRQPLQGAPTPADRIRRIAALRDVGDGCAALGAKGKIRSAQVAAARARSRLPCSAFRTEGEAALNVKPQSEQFIDRDPAERCDGAICSRAHQLNKDVSSKQGLRKDGRGEIGEEFQVRSATTNRSARCTHRAAGANVLLQTTLGLARRLKAEIEHGVEAAVNADNA